MVPDELRRRTYLGGAVAAVTECNETGHETTSESLAESESEPSVTATQELPSHDHSGAETGGAQLSPESVDAGRVTAEAVEAAAVTAARVNGTAYAAQFPGADLSAKVANAIEAIPAGGTVVITPRPDGEPWIWTETVRVNLRETGAVELSIRGQTMIEYTGDGWTLETTYRPAQYGQLERGEFFTLRGGNWRATGNPDGWLRMIDANFSEIAPGRVIDYTNDETTATGIRVEVQEILCESNVFTGHFSRVDVGMDFVPSDTAGVGGSGASFQGNYVRNLKVLNGGRFGFRWRDGAQCRYRTRTRSLARPASRDRSSTTTSAGISTGVCSSGRKPRTPIRRGRTCATRRSHCRTRWRHPLS